MFWRGVGEIRGSKIKRAPPKRNSISGYSCYKILCTFLMGIKKYFIRYFCV